MQINSNIQFNGSDYCHNRDGARLNGQLGRIWQVVKGGSWYTLAQLSRITGAPEASISSQLRNLRKPRFGSHAVEKEYLGGGLYRYRVIVNTASFAEELEEVH